MTIKRLLALGILCGLLAGSCGLPDPPDLVAPERSAVPSFGLGSWLQGLVDAPTRGSLAGTAFATDLVELIPTWHPVTQDISKPKVLFAGDVGELRIVVAAHRLGSEPQAIVLAAPRGTEARDMAGTVAAEPRVQPLTPYIGVSYVLGTGPVIETGVALAPPGCTISTGHTQTYRFQEVEWLTAPDKNHVTWTESAKSLFSKVDCARVNRYLGPAHTWSSPSALPASAAAVNAALANVRGLVPPATAKQLIERAATARPIAPAKVFYGGPLLGEPPPFMLGIAVAPVGPGHWTVVSADGSGGITSELMGFANDPLGPNGMVVLKHPRKEGVYIVVGPPSVVNVQLLDVTAALVGTVSLTDGIGTIERTGPVVGLIAFDSAGNKVATGTAPPYRPDLPAPPEAVEWWS